MQARIIKKPDEYLIFIENDFETVDIISVEEITLVEYEEEGNEQKDLSFNNSIQSSGVL